MWNGGRWSLCVAILLTLLLSSSDAIRVRDGSSRSRQRDSEGGPLASIHDLIQKAHADASALKEAFDAEAHANRRLRGNSRRYEQRQMEMNRERESQPQFNEESQFHESANDQPSHPGLTEVNSEAQYHVYHHHRHPTTQYHTVEYHPQNRYHVVHHHHRHALNGERYDEEPYDKQIPNVPYNHHLNIHHAPEPLVEADEYDPYDDQYPQHSYYHNGRHWIQPRRIHSVVSTSQTNELQQPAVLGRENNPITLNPSKSFVASTDQPTTIVTASTSPLPTVQPVATAVTTTTTTQNNGVQRTTQQTTTAQTITGKPLPPITYDAVQPAYTPAKLKALLSSVPPSALPKLIAAVAAIRQRNKEHYDLSPKVPNFPVDTSDKGIQSPDTSLLYSDKDSDLDLPGDEPERIDRLERRLQRLAEKLQEPPPENMSVRVKRNKILADTYDQLRREIAQTLENYALRTGDSLLPKELLESPVLRDALPPTSVTSIIDEYSRTTKDRVDDDMSARPEMLPGDIAARMLADQQQYREQKAAIAREYNAGAKTILSMRPNDGSIVSGVGGRPVMTVGHGDLPHADIRVHMLNPPHIVNEYSPQPGIDRPLLSTAPEVVARTFQIAKPNPDAPIQPFAPAEPSKYTVLPLPPMEAMDIRQHILDSVQNKMNSPSLLETSNEHQQEPVMMKKLSETEKMKIPFILPPQ